MSVTMLTVSLLWVFAAQGRAETPAERAWGVLEQALQDSKDERRASAAHALGLLVKNERALELAKRALADQSPEVRAAAAYGPRSDRSRRRDSLARGRAQRQRNRSRLDDVPERFATKARLRAGLGYRRDKKWRFELLYIRDGTRQTEEGSFETSANILDFRIKMFL